MWWQTCCQGRTRGPPTEWTHHSQVVRAIFKLWNMPHLDLFAIHFTHQLFIYVSPVQDPQAWAVGALSLSLEGLWAYPFLPTKLSSRC